VKEKEDGRWFGRERIVYLGVDIFVSKGCAERGECICMFLWLCVMYMCG
jgi:hypothetical protein